MTAKQSLKRIHFSLIISVLVNFVVYLALSIGLHQNIIFIIKAVVYLTGIILFFMTFRPFKLQSLYFSVYVLTPLLISLSWLCNGLVGAVLTSIFLAVFISPDKKFEDGDYVFYEKFQGFLGTCCTYNIFHSRLFILQEKVAELKISGAHSFEDSKFEVVNKTGYLKIKMEVYPRFNGPVREIDTILVVALK